MNLKIILFFVSALILFDPVHSVVCEEGDNACLLRRSRAFNKKVVNGIDGLIEPSDPLCTDEIKGKVKCITFTLTDVKLTGLKNCEILKSITEEVAGSKTLFYERTLFCPKLVVKYNFETNNLYNPVAVPRRGNATFTATNYVIIFKGQIEKFISKKDNKPHYRLKENSIDTKAKGKLSLVTAPEKNNSKVNIESTYDYLNSSKKALANLLECPIMRDLMDIYVERSDKYLRTLPIKDVLPL